MSWREFSKQRGTTSKARSVCSMATQTQKVERPSLCEVPTATVKISGKGRNRGPKSSAKKIGSPEGSCGWPSAHHPSVCSDTEVAQFVQVVAVLRGAVSQTRVELPAQSHGFSRAVPETAQYDPNRGTRWTATQHR
jgi:hypothetical protein